MIHLQANPPKAVQRRIDKEQARQDSLGVGWHAVKDWHSKTRIVDDKQVWFVAYYIVYFRVAGERCPETGCMTARTWQGAQETAAVLRRNKIKVTFDF